MRSEAGITRRAVLGCLGAVSLIFVVIGTLVVLRWNVVSDALDAQTEKTKVTLFRLGETMSIAARLKEAYGVEPDVTYDTGADGRVLGITFTEYEVPEDVTKPDHAREIAVLAIGETTKTEEIDVVKVWLPGDEEPHSFDRDELLGRRESG